MAEAGAAKVPSLAEDYLLEEKAQKQETAAETVVESEVKPITDAPIEESVAATVEEPIEDVTVTEAPAPEAEDVTVTEAPAPEVEDATVTEAPAPELEDVTVTEAPAPDGEDETASVAAEESKESSPTEEAQVDDPEPNLVEKSTEAVESENTGDQESEEPAEIKLETAPADFRFPTTNQTRHCFTRYVEYHRCIAAKGDGAPECDKFAKYYRSLCPGEWVERWNEQRENGTFPGPL